MKHIRFTIASLLVVVLFVAVCFAGLREANESWDSGLFSLTIAVLLLSILLAIYRTEKRRAFWLGFALFGSAYLGLSLVPSIESRLITTKALAYLDTKVPGRSPTVLSIRLALEAVGAANKQIQNVAVLTGDGSQFATSNQGQVTIWNAATGKLLWRVGVAFTENPVRIGHFK